MAIDFFPETNLENLNETLEKYGVAVLTNLFTLEECLLFRNTILARLESELNIIEPEDFSKLRPISGGIIRSNGLPFTKEVLELKTDRRVIEAFDKIWNGEELTGSFDAINITPPPELLSQPKFFSETNPNGLHLDQGSEKLDKCCIQSFINLEDTEHGDACLSVLTGSHLHFKDFMIDFKINTKGKDWLTINKQHLDWFLERGCQFSHIMAPKGSIVFWDSRTVHMGTLPREDRVNKNRWRFLVYTCYTPARFQSQDDANLKRYAYINNLPTSHWPFNVRLFKNSNKDGKKNSLSSLSIKQKKIFGLI